MAIRIGIDYTSALRERAGIGRFTRELVAALRELDRTNSYVLIHTRDCVLPSNGVWPDNFSFKRLPVSYRAASILWHRLSIPLPVDWATGPVEVFHAPDFLLPPIRRGKGILTVHDLSFLVHPECAEPSLARYLSRAVPRSLERADVVLADSESTKRDLTSLLGTPEEKVRVVYGGVNPSFRRVTDKAALDDVRRRYDIIEGPFIFGLGTTEPRKNLGRLISAYALLVRESTPDAKLLLAGGKGWLYQDLFDQIEKLKLTQDVRFLGYIPDADLPALLTLADVFAFPSLYEGFGLPPLEAMACGTPVVASDTSSLPEVLGEAAVTVSPTDDVALAQAIDRVLTDHELRKKMVEAGLAQARKFTWKASAERLLAIYTEVAS